MARKYNYIYKELVTGEDDIQGHIAYSLYKKDKISFIERFKREHNNQEPNEDDFKPFHETCCIDANLERYKMQACVILENFINNAMNDTIKKIEEDCINSQEERLKEIIKPVLPKSRLKVWVENIILSVIGAFAFALIVAAFAFINNYSASDINISFENKAKHENMNTYSPDTVKSVKVSNKGGYRY